MVTSAAGHTGIIFPGFYIHRYSLRTERLGGLGDDLRAIDRRGVDADLFGAGVERGPHVGYRAQSAADGHGHMDNGGDFRQRFQAGWSAIDAGDVVVDVDLVRALLVVPARELDWISDLA